MLKDWNKLEKVLLFGSIILVSLVAVIFKSDILSTICSILCIITALLVAKGNYNKKYAKEYNLEYKEYDASHSLWEVIDEVAQTIVDFYDK